MSLADGSRFSVSASDDYEAWELAGPSGLRMVSTPGGELTVWQGDAQTAGGWKSGVARHRGQLAKSENRREATSSLKLK